FSRDWSSDVCSSDLFLYDYRPKWTGIEERVYHPIYGYAGTADRFGVMDGLAGVLDVKTTSRIHNETGVQLAAYLEAANTQLPKQIGRATCRESAQSG